MQLIKKNYKVFRLISLANRAFGNYKWQIVILTVLGFIGGLLEGIGINAAIPLFSFISGSSSYGNDIVSRLIASFFSFLGIKFTFRYILAFIIVLFLLRSVALFICNYIKNKIGTDYEQKTRQELFSATLQANWPFLLKQKVGDLDTLLITNIYYSSLLLHHISGLVINFTGLAMYVLIAINISFKITVLTLLLGLLMVIAFQPLVRLSRRTSREKEEVNRLMAHYVNESVVCMKAIKTISVEKKVSKLAESYFQKLRYLVMRSNLARIISESFIQPVALIFVCLVFAYSYKSGSFNFIALAAVIYLIQKMFIYIQQLQGYLHSLVESAPFLQTVLDYRDAALSNQELKQTGKNAFNFKQNFEFKNVAFSYDRDVKVLNDVNFLVNKGEMIGLIGSSGGGKTTVVDLMLRLFVCASGEILLDGKNINNIDLFDWRKNIGYVSQDIFLLNDTIANNIKFFDDTISEKQIVEAAKMANIDDFINTCPEGYQTMMGERGVMLSVGQRQRIAIARVLVRKPKILILDEATSSLDSESEEKIQRVVENLKGKITVFVIAHRLSTVINADRLLILDKGKIVEQGVPGELLKDDKSYFYKIYNIK